MLCTDTKTSIRKMCYNFICKVFGFMHQINKNRYLMIANKNCVNFIINAISGNNIVTQVNPALSDLI